MSPTDQRQTRSNSAARNKLVDRLLESTRGLLAIYSMYLGDRLGLYAALAGAEALTSTELASQTGTKERYVREWLEHQTVAGILEVEDAAVDAANRRFFIPEGHKEVVADSDSLFYLAPLGRLAVGATRPIDDVLAAFRHGGGVPYSAYGANLREGEADLNRPMYLHQLGTEWLPSIEDVHARLSADPPARIADVGCGQGWSSIGMAKSYPRVRVDGLDLDEPSIEQARTNATKSGVADRVTFQVRDAGDPGLAGRYDLVTAFECVHDMSDPVSALRAMRGLVAENGTVLVVDEKVGEKFTGEVDDVERMMYGWSVLHCLPVGMADQPSAETGTVMRPDTLRRYASEAGFSDVEILPIEHMFFRFYRLVTLK